MDYKDILSRLKCPDDIEKCTRLKKYENSCVWCRDETMKDAADAIEILLAERDALYKLAKRCPMQNAKECSHYDECFKDAYDNMRIMRCASCVSWQWRGPQKGGG